jgi:hypothetical protein
MAIHHIIPKHEWKARFGNLKGVNAPDNLTPPLYNEQHAQVHTHYFNEITHIEYDRIAGLVISGQIGKEEANRLATVVANSGNKHSLGKKNALGSKHPSRSEEFRKEKAKAMMGHTNTPKVPQPKIFCPNCGVSGGDRLMRRWHFDNCRGRQ